uniref:Tail protein n=1 Tax=Siphoviridae sp. ctyvQ1 TaxID=2826525 RepID=A0A8S5QZY6_9CAUD|nr:MAG TPA: tail protein [Siphoviridae sp. ctyvQ1]
MSFTLHKKINGKNNPCYKKLRKTRLIHIDGFGYFTIKEAEEEFEDKVPHKSVTAYSAEYLLNNKGINLTFITTAGDINDSSSTTIVTSNYFFYKESQPEKSLLHQLIKVAPQWSIGYVSTSLQNKSRSFSETDKGLYGFLTNEVSQSYEALFVFDNENYVINAYDTTEVIKNTNIVLSFDNLLKSANITELSDDIYTVINVSGAENLSIAKINPNGTKKLFCLDYYTGVLDKDATNYYENYNEWITDNALKKKVLDWEAANKEAIYDKSEGSYGSWTALQKKFNLLLLTQQAALNQMQSYYETAQQNMSVYTDYSELDKLIVEAKKGGRTEYIEYGKAKREGWTISNYLEVAQFTTDTSHSVTRYAYWKNYSQACESNLEILKSGGRLYSVRAEDFSVEGSINSAYNVKSDATIVATGDKVSSEVKNHSITPSDGNNKYSIDALEAEIKSIQSERDKIVKKYSYEDYFTDAEKLALDPFIIEGSFSDDSFIVTDSMQTKDYSKSSTKVEVVQADGQMVIKTIGDLKQDDVIMDDIYVAGQLVDAGYEKLKVVSRPNFSFEMESSNFLFIEKFKPFIDQLTNIEKNKGSLFGSILNVKLEDDNWVYPYLQEMEINYDDPDSFSMTFGNRFRLSNDTYTFDELHNETTSAVSSVGSLLSAVSQPVTNGTIDAVTQYTKKALVAANQSIKATEDNEFTFGSYGIKGKKKSTEQDNINGFDPEQLWISNNKICFTTDGWATTKAVFGKTVVGGVESYGLIADSIVGKLIMGENLIISNPSNTFEVNDKGISVSNDNISIKMNPDVGFDIVRKTAEDDVGVFQVDKNGNMTITGGKITVGNGSNLGYIIDGVNGTMKSVLTDSDGHPLFELTADGKLKTSGVFIGNTAIVPDTPTVDIKGDGGYVQPSGSGLTGGLWERISTIVAFYALGPYDATLNLVGQTDSKGWRKIWGYYSDRTDPDTFVKKINSSGYTDGVLKRVEQGIRTAIDTNNINLEKIYLKENVFDDTLKNYKNWNDTKTEIENSYYSKADINAMFNVTADVNTTWKTITVDGQSINVLVKS